MFIPLSVVVSLGWRYSFERMAPELMRGAVGVAVEIRPTEMKMPAAAIPW